MILSGPPWNSIKETSPFSKPTPKTTSNKSRPLNKNFTIQIKNRFPLIILMNLIVLKNPQILTITLLIQTNLLKNIMNSLKNIIYPLKNIDYKVPTGDQTP
jgi:hypothetical protein